MVKTYVWDLFIRVFHWMLLTAFVLAFVSDESLIIHIWAGYAIGGLIAARVLWGFIGPPHARFSDFVYPPRIAFGYVRDLLRFRAGERVLGHSPGGGYVIILMLVFLFATVMSGVIAYGGLQQAGPLAGLIAAEAGEAADDWHEALAYITLGLICIHTVGVFLRSFVYGENLVRAMITGYKLK